MKPPFTFRLTEPRTTYMNALATNGVIQMPNKTIYVTEEDAPVWEEAKRLLRFHHDKGISAFVTPLLKDYIAKEKARQAKKED